MADNVIVNTPVGRLINGALWEKDVYKNEQGKESTPQYKIEMAFDWDDIEELQDAIYDAAIAEWGDDAEEDLNNGKIRNPILDGDELANERERKGKNGDAYRGKAVIRAGTIYNKDGSDAPGGVYVCDTAAKELDFSQRGTVYNGSYGIASVEVKAYKVDGRGVTLYLQGYQFVEDGEPLRGKNPSSLFSKVSKPQSGESKGRRGRK